MPRESVFQVLASQKVNCERVTVAIISLGGGASDVYTLNIYFSLFFFLKILQNRRGTLTWARRIFMTSSFSFISSLETSSFERLAISWAILVSHSCSTREMEALLSPL